MRRRSPSDALPESATALLRCSKKSLAVGALLARANSADAKSGSSAMALSKCAIDSWASSFSARSRPCRNSFFASSDLVVMGILPPSEAAEADCPELPDLLQAINMMALTTRIATKIHRIDFPKFMPFLLRACENCNLEDQAAVAQYVFRSQNDECPYLLDVGGVVWIAADGPSGQVTHRWGVLTGALVLAAARLLCDTQAGKQFPAFQVPDRT